MKVHQPDKHGPGVRETSVTIRESVTDDQRERLFAWAAIALAAALAAGAILVAWHEFASPYPPAGVSDGIDP